MKNFLLKLIGDKAIARYIISQAKLEEPEDAPTEYVWQNVYRLTPELKKWLKKREIQLLKSQMLRDKPSDFILGQIFENKIYQRFDVANEANLKVESLSEEVKIPDKDEFLKKWNQYATGTGEKT